MAQSLNLRVTLGSTESSDNQASTAGSTRRSSRVATAVGTIATLLSLVFLIGAVVAFAAPSAANAQDGNLHWAKNVVYVVSSAPAAWPVATAAKHLADYSSLQLVPAKSCPAKAQCIYVKSTKLTGTTVGSTTYSYSGRTIVSATVFLDSRFAGSSYRNRLTDATHELGHAVGLNHTNDKTSCMYPDVSVGATTPNTADYNRLRLLYPAKR